MSEDKKKATKAVEDTKGNDEKEISIDQLDEVTGGALKNVKYTPTKPISDDTKGKI